MKSRDCVPRAHPTSGPRETEWDAVTKPGKTTRDWQARASLMAIMYAAALAGQRRARRR
jgi:hypothetical protein